jgi:hypothetical protein
MVESFPPVIAANRADFFRYWNIADIPAMHGFDPLTAPPNATEVNARANQDQRAWPFKPKVISQRLKLGVGSFVAQAGKEYISRLLCEVDKEVPFGSWSSGCQLEEVQILKPEMNRLPNFKSANAQD